ncbi:phosphoglucosamine mutase [Candidatus Saccharibacteria bacterium]|nr:phosphoglucosamine mutase [Candidatus Saccharibacteria bacterium]
MDHFGTDGIRGKADQFDLTFIVSIIEGLVDYAGDNIKVLIGGDTRESSEWILRDLEIALETFGIEYSSVNVLSTPAINYCFYEMGYDFAIDVTASHNPYTDNGIKVFERGDGQGIKLCEKGRKAIEKSLKEPKEYNIISPSPREDLQTEAIDIYKKHLLDYVQPADFTGLHLGLDCANGATSVISSSLFEQLGAKVKRIHADPHYGTKINKNCGSTHLESLRKTVLDNHLDFGIAFDGDGDRCMFIDEKGGVVDGDQVIAILAEYLKLDTVATTVMVNQGFISWAKKNGINIEITAVGDTNVKIAMDEKHIKLGGEQSGHIILPGEATGDGMLTALVLTKIISESKKTLSELASSFVKFPQIVVNMPATPEQKANLKEKEPAKKLLLEYSEKLKPIDGRLLVRPSGTESLIRITLWGDDESTITTMANELKDKLTEIL